MSRLLFAAAGLALLPAAALADPMPFAVPPPAQPAGPPPKPVAVRAQPVVPVGLFDTPKAGCSSCGGSVIPPGYGGYTGYGTATAPATPGGPHPFGDRLQKQLWWDEHNCAPDGCPKPVGCGNFWTEFKFVFGGCRQFFGTGQSVNGHLRCDTTERAR